MSDDLTKDATDPLNMAECRSALEAIADSARTGSISTLPSASLVLKTCEKALAAKPRVCDVHTADELKVIFNSELVLELPIANEHEKNLVTITAMGVIDTLFATAKKGGDDGK